MESVLYELFSGDYDITPKPDKKQQELSKASWPSWTKSPLSSALNLWTICVSWRGTRRTGGIISITAPAFSWAHA